MFKPFPIPHPCPSPSQTCITITFLSISFSFCFLYDMRRPPCCDKSNVKRVLWTPEEDAKILAYVSDHGPRNWTSVPKKAGLRRSGKSCRLRYTNYLRPALKQDNFTPQEEELIINLHAAIGSRWSLIAHQLPGRTDNDVKNHWNTKLKKRLLGVGINPVTHRPISQILTPVPRSWSDGSEDSDSDDYGMDECGPEVEDDSLEALLKRREALDARIAAFHAAKKGKKVAED